MNDDKAMKKSHNGNEKLAESIVTSLQRFIIRRMKRDIADVSDDDIETSTRMEEDKKKDAKISTVSQMSVLWPSQYQYVSVFK